ncbi:flagellar hook-associated protein FlgL [Pacificimonas sp. WHA3]|uniref:Flagellar hook-associated protein FlgL n=1 Tax=Pacificimonas pallii TaxID=2827236 RepID=A0ABS6SGI6_9SPHN|nr:flagellar hook-associated protein FlgL [Pacificimonas pallii]MBV7257021.1 flagellar hook-associated protein FlgL [Pacificimonas pallii]
MLRISTASWYVGQVNHMARLQGESSQLQTSIATGKRMISAADDPVASARADRFARLEADSANWKANGDVASRRLESSSDALSAMASDITRIRELALVAANDTQTPADRHIVAAEIEQLTDGLLSLANRRDSDGRYVFAGAASGQPAYARDGGGSIVWQGSGTAPLAPIGADRTVSVGDRGDVLFAADDGTSLFAAAEELIAVLRATPSDQAETDSARADRKLGMGTALDRLDSLQSNLSEASATQGARLQQLDATTERLDIDILEASIARGALEDTDITRAIVDLERTLTLLQAAQAGFTRISGLSLFERL